MAWDDADQRLTDQLANQLEEFFSSYVLVGYTLKGDRVRMKHSPTSKDWDALQQILEDTVAKEFKLPDLVQLNEAGE